MEGGMTLIQFKQLLIWFGIIRDKELVGRVFEQLDIENQGKVTCQEIQRKMYQVIICAN